MKVFDRTLKVCIGKGLCYGNSALKYFKRLVLTEGGNGKRLEERYELSMTLDQFYMRLFILCSYSRFREPDCVQILGKLQHPSVIL